MKKKLLLHACCAPCLTAVEERLRESFDIDILWYNPNIYPLEEEQKRLGELRRYANKIKANLIIHPNDQRDTEEWQSKVVNFSDEPEGRRRCQECIYFRLSKLAQFAKREKYKLLGTTLSVSPRKNSLVVNNAGKQTAVNNDLEFLEGDYKKQNGYLRSIELSKENGLYRQNYCGCIYSLRERDDRTEKLQTAARP